MRVLESVIAFVILAAGVAVYTGCSTESETPVDTAEEIEPADVQDAGETEADSTEEPSEDSTEEPAGDSTEEPTEDSTEEPTEDSTEPEGESSARFIPHAEMIAHTATAEYIVMEPMYFTKSTL